MKSSNYLPTVKMKTIANNEYKKPQSVAQVSPDSLESVKAIRIKRRFPQLSNHDRQLELHEKIAMMSQFDKSLSQGSAEIREDLFGHKRGLITRSFNDNERFDSQTRQLASAHSRELMAPLSTIRQSRRLFKRTRNIPQLSFPTLDSKQSSSHSRRGPEQML